MSRGVNKVILIGNLGGDPELKYTQNGHAVATFNVATTERRPDKDNNWTDHTEWHRVVTWRKLAETVGEYLKKGSQVYIEGRIQTRQWEDKDGVKRYQTEIVAQNLQMLGRRSDDDAPAAADNFPVEPEPDQESGGEESSELPF